MRYIVLTISLLTVLAACTTDEPRPIEQDKMSAIMADIHLAETYSTMANPQESHLTNKNFDSLARYYQEVLAHHEITLDEFRTGLSWYTARPKKLDSVYAQILERLSTLEGNLNAENEE